MDKIEVETQKIQNNTSTSETKINIPDNIKEHGKEIEKIQPKTKDDYHFKEHRQSIDRIFVSQYMDDISTYNEKYGSDDFVVTYSSKDKSVLGWSIKENEPKPDVYFKIDKIDDIFLDNSILNKKILLLRSFNNPCSDRTSSSSDRFLKLKHQVHNLNDDFGFLPNGDLIQVSLIERKIYKYCFTDKPKNTVPWEYSQINDIKIRLNEHVMLLCSISRTKLFLFFEQFASTYPVASTYKMLQFDLLSMNLERTYHEIHPFMGYRQITVNKDQTLLTILQDSETYIYSMENGMLIYKSIDSECVGFIRRAEFITLKNTERLAICSPYGSKLVDPYQVYDEIGISYDFNNTSVITKLNRKIFTDNGNVCVTNGIDENELQQLSNKIIYRNTIYSLSTFKIIQSMFNKIIEQDEIKKVVSHGEKIVLKDGFEIKNLGLCRIVLYHDYSNRIGIEDNNGNLVHSFVFSDILSIKLLNNKDLIVIDIHGISIQTINEIWLETRYLWRNNEWKNIYDKFFFMNNYDNINAYKPIFREILKNEFDDSKRSIPFPIFIEGGPNVVKDVISDNLASPKFGIEMLKIAIKKKHQDTIQQIINSTQNYSENYMSIISLNLAELCDYYPDFIIKYISSTSIMLSPYCIGIEDSKNTSLYSYANIIYIKKSNIEKPISAKYEKVSFIVPFPQIYIWNLFDVGAYLLPIITSIFWLINKNQPPWLTEISIILLILGYAQAFFIVLRSNNINDDNDPQNLATKYNFINPNGTISNTTAIIQDPDSNTNLFNWFPTSLLAVYNLLTGDSGSLSSFTYRENPIMTILLVTFTFFTVIYLMNLFIGLLNIAIDDYNKEEEYLLQKAQIIMEIELFYMLPWQRNKKEWFPDWIYYDIPITKIRNLINAIDNNQTVFNYPPIISEKLRNLVVFTDDNNKLEKKIDRIMKYIEIEQDNKLEKQIEQTKEELVQQNTELKQQMDKLKQQMENITKLLLKRSENL
ncbi:20920_t:CDS:2 [Rhizophagus irregularis]|nr:20920_t:CDS:2 [Rhizophagus irregularis]